MLQTFASTGDLPAAHVAVRDAYAAAWHHWRKVSALEDPQEWLRLRAWRLAQRRDRARLWRRRSLSAVDDPADAVLGALGQLTSDRRKALLLTQLVGLSLSAAAREMGVSQEGMAGVSREAVEASPATSTDKPRQRLASTCCPWPRQRPEPGCRGHRSSGVRAGGVAGPTPPSLPRLRPPSRSRQVLSPTRRRRRPEPSGRPGSRMPGATDPPSTPDATPSSANATRSRSAANLAPQRQ